MSEIYDNWERLVAAVLKKKQLWELFNQPPTPSNRSEASSSSFSSFNVSDLGSDFLHSSKWQRSYPSLVRVSDFSPRIDIKDASRTSSVLLGRGTFGSAYTATIDDCARIVVKRLKSATVSHVDFQHYMGVVGGVRHENVVALRAYYSFEDQRLMIYDYYAKGSMYSLLHGQRDENRVHVDWETRLKIAIGACKGIAAIHRELGGMLVHGNIKASNVFLNSDSYGCVSDLGLASMIKTTFDSTAHCYAPEVMNTQNISQASDVYSFGILLLELLTGLPSVHVPGGPAAVDLVKLLNSVKSRETAAKVFDADLLKHRSINEQMVKMLQIGIKCVAKSVKNRPQMFEVVKMLEDLIPTNTTLEAGSPQENRIVFFEDENYSIFDKDDLFDAMPDVLGKGSFGTCYLTRLKNGNRVVVKRLKDVIIAFEEFQQHMDVLGRMRHENVAKLRAYHFSKELKFLIYDHYDQGHLYTMLHGELDEYLEWSTRLEIAVGAARGIAHIHSQMIIHGNVKSSNIFINEQTYGIVSDAGLIKLTGPGKTRVLSWGYRAPEIRATRIVSQASDVYSFGVVLLELVSGRPSEDHVATKLVKWVQAAGTDKLRIFDKYCFSNETEEAMIKVFELAMKCVSTAPEHRPTMSHVVQVLEEIRGIESGELSFDAKLGNVLENLLSTLTS